MSRWQTLLSYFSRVHLKDHVPQGTALVHVAENNWNILNNVLIGLHESRSTMAFFIHKEMR
jgi:hypothetical protein